MAHESTLTTRSYECDSYGHVNNAVYLNYLEFARIRFLNTANTEKVTFGVSDFDPAQGPKSVNVGGSAWQSGSISFKTGAASTNATLFIEKSGGTLNGYVDQTQITTDTPTSTAITPESMRKTILFRIYLKKLQISGLNRHGHNQIRLITLNGRTVKRAIVSGTSEYVMSLCGISSGVYFLEVVSHGCNIRERIIISR